MGGRIGTDHRRRGGALGRVSLVMCSCFQGFLKENGMDQNDIHALSPDIQRQGAPGDRRVSVIEMGWRRGEG